MFIFAGTFSLSRMSGGETRLNYIATRIENANVAGIENADGTISTH
jgi:hypothetical protein